MSSSISLKWYWAAGAALLAAAGAVYYKYAFAITAFNPADAPIGYVAQDDMTNYNLKSGKEVLFRGEYEREFWSGALFAYPISSKGVIAGNSDYWSGSASALVTAQNFDTGRYIATMKDNGTAVGFRWDNLSANQQTAIGDTNVFNFLRGDRSNELPGDGKTLRQRATVLGDIVHSRPFYVADATNPTVFVGANDGMLHAFHAGPKTVDATDVENGGRERWAYVPSMLIPKLKKLAATTYVHTYFVDGQINIGTINSGAKRVLVGGLGAGGKGLYALNITGSAGLAASNEAAVASKVRWESTPSKLNYATPGTANGYVNLGYTYGTVTLAKVNGVDAVIVGNGYNDGADPDGLGIYSNCSHATPTYSNCGGNYGSYLYIINADTGQLISAVKAGDGTAASPNGLSTPVAVDSDGDGSVDRIFAGDLNGTMWKFVIAGDGTVTKSALLVTSPQQAITSTPGVAIHPNGGYMVNFATGKMLVTSDTTDTAVHYAYGAWDSAPVANTSLVTQTLTARTYYAPGSTTPVSVRRVTSTQPVWTSGGNLGWKVALPAGERVIGEGSFIENGRFYFNSHNPTVDNPVPNTNTVVKGSNWQIELDYLSGGTVNIPFLDLSGEDNVLDNNDRLKYVSGDTIPTGSQVGDPIMTTDGIPVAKYLQIGVMSQPVLVQLETLNDTLYNQNPDVVVPAVPQERGVVGGHFDVEIYYAGSPATVTMTIGTTGQSAGYPATLGAITVNGVEIVPALTTADIPDGTKYKAIAQLIASKVKNGFTAVASSGINNTYRVTFTAPTVGTGYNSQVLTIGTGTSQTLVTAAPAVPAVPAVAEVTGIPPTGLIRLAGTSGTGTNTNRINNTITVNGSDTGNSVRIASTGVNSSDINIGKNQSAADAAAAVVAAGGWGGNYVVRLGGDSITPTCQNVAAPKNTVVCIVDKSAATTAYGSSNGKAVTVGSIRYPGTMTATTTATAGGVSYVAPVAGSPYVPEKFKSGWTNLRDAIGSNPSFSGGVENTGNTCNSGLSKCDKRVHEHEYDDLFDRTGMNFLDPGDPVFALSRGMPSTATQFKVLVHNQYLNPAAKLHIGRNDYTFNKDVGYVSIKNYQTSNTLDVPSLPTYTRASIGSFAVNFPVDAFTPKDWWGGAGNMAEDIRPGLIPNEPECVYQSDNASYDGNMYRPVNPPLTVTTSGNGTKGWSSSTVWYTSPQKKLSSNPDKFATVATGVRHNGGLTIQIIKADTPNTAVELNVAGRPEYGWRVKADLFSTYVIGEYTFFWHTKHLGVCYGDSDSSDPTNVKKNWNKLPTKDDRPCAPSGSHQDTSTLRDCEIPDPPGTGTDPKIGLFADTTGGGNVVSSTTTTVDNVTTTTTTYSNSSFPVRIVRTVRPDGSIEIVTTTEYGSGGNEVTTTQIIANKSGANASGGDERGFQARTGRISWRELVRQD